MQSSVLLLVVLSLTQIVGAAAEQPSISFTRTLGPRRPTRLLS